MSIMRDISGIKAKGGQQPPTKSILRDTKKTDRNLYPVYYGGINVTPKPLNPLSFKEGKERQISILNIASESNEEQEFTSFIQSQAYQSGRYSIDLHLQNNLGDSASKSFQQTFVGTFIELAPGKDTLTSFLDKEYEVVVEKPSTMPSKISLVLVETPTFFIFDIASKTADKDSNEGRCVTAVCWNPINEDVLAVGYGKFYYSEETTGMIMIWNIKNPVQPERVYNFPEPVTSVDFSKQHPNLLAIGFYDGNIRVIDVSDTNTKCIGASSREDSPLFEPIWQVEWYTDDDYYKGMEFLMATSQDGRISRFNLERAATMPYFHLMRVSRAEGKLKGLKVTNKCVVPGIPIARHPGALVLRQHAIDSNIYYVGTSEGVVHKCSKNYYHQHLDLFLAHEGPIYQIKFSPFCDRIFLTCGDDWTVRIWAEGISEPLLELSKTMQTVQGADWSPCYSTIIANVSGNEIFIWDLQRKSYAPQSITKSPTKSRCTIVQFTNNGRCLLVADIEGNVHIFSLEEMPYPAFFQGDLLTQAIKRELIIKPNILRKVEKLEGLSYDKSKFKKHFR